MRCLLPPSPRLVSSAGALFAGLAMLAPAPGTAGVGETCHHRVPGDTPPPGPPWQLTYAAAKQLALRKGQPVFTYFTKTY